MILYKVITPDGWSLVTHSRYRLHYSIGSTTRADPRTMGVFCVDTLADAMFMAHGQVRVVIVKSVGRVRRPRHRFPHLKPNLFIKDRRTATLPCAHGIVCCPAVMVLKELEDE